MFSNCSLLPFRMPFCVPINVLVRLCVVIPPFFYGIFYHITYAEPYPQDANPRKAHYVYNKSVMYQQIAEKQCVTEHIKKAYTK